MTIEHNILLRIDEKSNSYRRMLWQISWGVKVVNRKSQMKPTYQTILPGGVDLAWEII
jgi:hypothetical protein